MDTIQRGATAGTGQEVDLAGNAMMRAPGTNAAGVIQGGGHLNAPQMQSEIDDGTITGLRECLSPETDQDYRLRVAHDNPIDSEEFVDTAQNTAKFFHAFATLTATISSAGLLTNSGNITTTATGMTFGSLISAPVGGTQTYVCETSIGFSAPPTANTVVDFGGFLRGGANPYLPQDGVFFRLTSAGLFGVVSKAGVETATAVFPLALGAGIYVYANNANNRFLIQSNNVSTSFWINNVKYGEIDNPVSGGFPCQSRALTWGIRHAIVGGTAGSPFQCLVTGYRVLVRGPLYADRLAVASSRTLGTYQGLSGGTMGSLATLPNSTNPVAGVPTNTTLAANLPGGLGGQGLVTAAVAAVTDLIWGSYQVPAGSLTVQPKRLVIRGVMLDLINTGAAVATTATTLQFSLAFGHTAVSLGQTDSGSFATGTTKSPRKVSLGFATWPIAAAIGQGPQNGRIFADFGDSPIYVNPGEFVALVGKFLLGTATASQTINFVWQPLYGWE